MNKTLTIIMPAFNEEESLRTFLPEAVKHCELRGYKLIVANDGSTDETKVLLTELLQKTAAMQTVNHKLNRGYGAAIKSGIMNAQTDFVVTVDADGQHRLEDVDKLFREIETHDADMIIGSRAGQKSATIFRGMAKWFIRFIAKILMPLPINDLNSGMKMYNTALAKKYISLCPDNMAYSDTIALLFVNQRHLVLETPITIQPRISGRSTLGFNTAFETIMAIINIVMLFNPMKIFLPASLLVLFISLLWGIPIVLRGDGVSVGTLLGITLSIFLFFLGLIAEQISQFRKKKND